MRDARGRPAARALARLGFRPWAPVGTTDAEGRIEVAAFPRTSLPLIVEDAAGGLAEVALPTEAGRAEILRVYLRPYEVLAGKALDARTRAPLPGAVVWSQAYPSDPCVRAGADGGFRLPVHRSPRLAVLAGAAGHVPVHVEVGATGAASAVATLLLPPAAEIAGVVVDAQGRPVARARVQGRATRWDRAFSSGLMDAATGPDGRFRLPRLAAGLTYQLQVTREGFAPGSVLAESTPPGKGTPIRIVLAAGRTASGRVADPDGRPVPGAELTLSRSWDPGNPSSGGMPRSWRATSDASGAFELRDLAPGVYRLYARARGFASGEKAGLEIPAGGGAADLGILVLVPGATVEGRVVDSRNQPVEGAHVRIMERRPQFGPGAALPQDSTTGADGSFRLADLPPGERIELVVQHPDHPPVQVPGVEVPPAEPLVVELREGGALAGRVVGADGQPIEGAMLTRHQTTSITIGGAQSTQSSGHSVATTDARGRFHAANQPPGSGEIEVAARGWMPARLRGLAIPAAGTLDVGDVVLQRGAVLEGTVRDGDGNPVAGVYVSVWGKAGEGGILHAGLGPERTDAEGRFRKGGLEPGPYQVSAQSPDQEHAEAEVQVQPGTNRVELAFARGVEVAGRVVDEHGGAVPEVSVALHPEGAGHQLQTVSRVDGSFRFRRVRPGEYRVRAARRGYAAGEAGPVAVAELAVGGVEVRLTAKEDSGPALRGRFLGLPEREQAEVRVHARSPSGRGFAPGFSDGRGGYAFEDLEPGDWEISAMTESGRHAAGTVRIEPGAGTAVLDLDFGGEGGFTLTGSVTAGGRPLAGAQVSVAGGEPGGVTRGTRSGYDGRFEISDLTPGPYTLLVAQEGTGLGTVRRVDLAEDSELAIEVETGSLQARVVSAATGEPVPGALVRLTLHHEQLQTGFAGPAVLADEAGALEVSGLGVGSYRLAIEVPGFAPTEASVEVRRGTPAQITIRIEPR